MSDRKIVFIVGAAKAGTTTIYRHLSRHSEIVASTPKETNFFDANFSLDPEVYLDRHFQNATSGHFLLDATPAYLYVPYVTQRISALFPNAKFVVMLRDPVERAYSEWWMYHNLGYDRRPFACAIQDELALIDQAWTPSEIEWKHHVQSIQTHGKALYPPYLSAGLYALQLSRFFTHFPRSSFSIHLFEDLVAQPENVTSTICKFLDIEHNETVLSAIENPGSSALKGRIYRLIGPARVEKLSRYMPVTLKSNLKRILEKGGKRPQVAPLLRNDLLKFFTGDLDMLEKLIERDLSAWRLKSP